MHLPCHSKPNKLDGIGDAANEPSPPRPFYGRSTVIDAGGFAGVVLSKGVIAFGGGLATTAAWSKGVIAFGGGLVVGFPIAFVDRGELVLGILFAGFWADLGPAEATRGDLSEIAFFFALPWDVEPSFLLEPT